MREYVCVCVRVCVCARAHMYVRAFSCPKVHMMSTITRRCIACYNRSGLVDVEGRAEHGRRYRTIPGQ